MDITLSYTEKGQGEVLILLHGNGEDRSYFEHQIAHFSEKYRVIAIDTRGHGESPRGEKDFSIRQFADDLYDFMEEKQIEKGHILGFSDGGNIAIVFSLKYPHKVDRLILNGANLNGAGVKFMVQLPIVMGYYVTSFFAKWSLKAKRNREMLGLMVKDPNISPNELKKIQAPTLVIAGTKDMIKDKHTKMIGEKIPHAKTVILQGNHFIANNNSAEFNEIVEDFLQN